MKKGEKPRANPLVVLREEFDDWAVLFDPDAGQGFGLNPTGVYVWKLLDGKHSVDDMLEALHRDADGVPQEAGEHIVTFLEELTEHGLTERDRESSSDCERPLPSCCACAGATKLTYEPPKLVNLSGEQAACGASCSGGSDATGTCSVGNNASVVCGQGFYASSVNCSAGTGPGTACCGGSTRSGDWSVACKDGAGPIPNPPGCCSQGPGGN